jgi:hypothetical protein
MMARLWEALYRSSLATSSWGTLGNWLLHDGMVMGSSLSLIVRNIFMGHFGKLVIA